MTPSLLASRAPVWGAAQRNQAMGIDGNEQQAQQARPLRLRLAMQMKGLRKRRFGFGLAAVFARATLLACGFGSAAAHQGLQQLARVLKVAAPQQTLACAH
jgi:hypothetical protein